MSAPRVLISTIAARTGGVPVQVRMMIDVLRDLRAEPVIAFYEPYSMSPMLSVPTFRLGTRFPAERVSNDYEGCETHAMGAWLPEFEFSTYWARRSWRTLMDGCEAHVVVAGNVLPALPFWQSGRPFLAWVASDWSGDRRHRVATFPLLRRAFDRLLVRPVATAIESRLIGGGTILAVSEYSANELVRCSPGARIGVCGNPIRTDLFQPSAVGPTVGLVGFSGRIDDPRKNFGLLLDVMERLNRHRTDIRLRVLGGAVSHAIQQDVRSRHLNPNALEFLPFLPVTDMAQRVQEFDVFALPSHQEGLCIAALEAMACGVPVVSTRCGGPEDYILPGENGELVENSAEGFCSAIERLVDDRALRERYGMVARRTVVERYARTAIAAQLREHLSHTFPSVFASGEPR
ncbi:MAG: glycosyltransferase family 4 protein [Burkholderiales bacterium]|nr:glycosyltransferase family 4 protein [Burkholderiales bacterium]